MLVEILKSSRTYAYEKDYILNPAICICKNLANTIDDSLITFDKIIYAVDSVSTNVSANVTCTVPMNTANTVSINFDDEKVGYKMNCYILNTVLLVLILLFIIAIVCRYCTKHRLK